MNRSATSDPGLLVGSRLPGVDFDVSKVNDRARIRYYGWKTYLGLGMATWFLGLLLFVLVYSPPPPSRFAQAAVVTVPAALLGGLFLVIGLSASVPGLHLLPQQRKEDRARVQRIVGDAHRMTFVHGDGREDVFSISDPAADVQLRCPSSLLGHGQPPPKVTPWMVVKLSGDRFLGAPLTLDMFQTLRTLLLSSGAEPFENEHVMFDGVPSHGVYVGKAARRVRTRARFPQGRAKERTNPAERDLIVAQDRAIAQLFWIVLALALPGLILGSLGGVIFGILAQALVLPFLAVCSLTVVLSARARKFAKTFPAALEIEPDAVTGIYTIRNDEDSSTLRVFRTISFENVAELKPWREGSCVDRIPAPAAVFGKFETDPVHPLLKLPLARRDRNVVTSGARDVIYLARENYEPVKVAWEEWMVGAVLAGVGAGPALAGKMDHLSEVHRSGPVRLPAPPGG